MKAQGEVSRAYDDLDDYLESLTVTEREEIADAGAAIDLAVLLYRVRAARGLTQSAAARRASLAQQAVSRFERPSANLRLDTLQRYLSALGYVVEITVKDAASNAVAARMSLPSLENDEISDSRLPTVARDSAA